MRFYQMERINDLLGGYFGFACRVIHIVEYPKCGGTWLRKMLQTALDIDVDSDSETFRFGQNVLQRHKLYKKSYRRPVLIVRDPRDVFVSYFFHETQHKPIASVLNAFAYDEKKAMSENMFNFIKFKLERASESHPYCSYVDFVEGWMNNCSELVYVRYEDLHQNAKNELNRIFYTLGIAVPEGDLARAVEMNSFEKMSGGRKAGEEDVSSHRRKGIVGDWENYFTSEMLEYVSRMCGGAFSKLGYDF